MASNDDDFCPFSNGYTYTSTLDGFREFAASGRRGFATATASQEPPPYIVPNPMMVSPSTDGDRRKGKRKPKEVQNTKGPKAVWDGEKRKNFIQIAVQQVRMGYKPGGSLLDQGYKNLIKEFNAITKLCYDKSKMKNHWDSPRKDWNAWNYLKKKTGLGWDTEKKTFVVEPDWWKTKAKAYPGIEKFKEGPLQHEEELALFFSGMVAKGDDKQVPSHPNTQSDYASNAASSQRQAYELVPPQNESVEAHPMNATKSNNCSTGEKRRRSAGPSRMNLNVGAVCEALNKRTCILDRAIDTFQSCSIQECLRLLKLTQFQPDSDEWFFALTAFKDFGTRQLWCFALETTESRISWLQRHFDIAQAE